jgi:hypothetical protein
MYYVEHDRDKKSFWNGKIFDGFFEKLANLQLINYTCSMETDEIRTIVHTDEFDEFYNSLDDSVKDKFDEYFVFLESIYALSTKIVKKLVNTERLYELRVSVGYNEYRTAIFSVNHDNIIQATKI